MDHASSRSLWRGWGGKLAVLQALQAACLEEEVQLAWSKVKGGHDLAAWGPQGPEHDGRQPGSTHQCWRCVQGTLALPEALKAARLEEDFQLEEWGKVEGGHDLDEGDVQVRVAAPAVFARLAAMRNYA